MEDDVSTAALAFAALTALVGTQIHWNKLPDRKRLPALIFHQTPSAGRTYTLRGRVPTTAWRIQADGWGRTSAEATAVRDAAAAFFDTLNTAPLQAFIERDHAGWDPAAGAASDRSTDLFRASLDVRVWRGTATPE